MNHELSAIGHELSAMGHDLSGATNNRPRATKVIKIESYYKKEGFRRRFLWFRGNRGLRGLKGFRVFKGLKGFRVKV